MPSRKTHALFGSLAVSAGYVIYKNINNEEIDLIELCGAAALGVCAGILPDILEPAKNPHHRKFFHSIAIAILGMMLRNQTHNVFNIDNSLKIIGDLFLTGYLSHLTLDGFTPKGLPIA